MQTYLEYLRLKYTLVFYCSLPLLKQYNNLKKNKEFKVYGLDGKICIHSEIKKLKEAARHYGLDEGKPIFFSGHRHVTDEELAEQRVRGEMGMVPDPQDLPAMMEYVEEVREMGLA